MTIKNYPILYYGILIISICFIPSFFSIFGGAILLRWYLGFSLVSKYWAVESRFTFHIFDLLFCLIILGIGIIVLIIGLKDKKKQEESNNIIVSKIGIILIILTIIHSIYFYWEGPFAVWIPIVPIILIYISFNLNRLYLKINKI